MRASLLCIPQSRLPHPLRPNGAMRAGTAGWKRAPLVASSVSAMVSSPGFADASLPPGLAACGPPQRVEQAVFGDGEHACVDLAPGRVALVVGCGGSGAWIEGGAAAPQLWAKVGQAGVESRPHSGTDRRTQRAAFGDDRDVH